MPESVYPTCCQRGQSHSELSSWFGRMSLIDVIVEYYPLDPLELEDSNLDMIAYVLCAINIKKSSPDIRHFSFYQIQLMRIQRIQTSTRMQCELNTSLHML